MFLPTSPVRVPPRNGRKRWRCFINRFCRCWLWSTEKRWVNFGATSFCQLEISSTYHSVYLTFRQLDVSSICQFDISSTYHSAYLTFRQLDVSSTCQFDILSTWLSVNLTFCQIDNLSTCHYINLTFYQPFHFANILIYQLVISSTTFHQLDSSSTWHFINFPGRHIRRTNDDSPKQSRRSGLEQKSTASGKTT